MRARFAPPGPLRGELTPPADKSVSHRAALIGAMTDGHVRVSNYLDAGDTNSTLDAVRALGCEVWRGTQGTPECELLLRGCGLRGTREPDRAIDVGNAGTLMRLLPGWLAAQEGRSFTLDGDASIRRRPVDRIAGPLREMGAQIAPTEDRFPPLRVTGAALRGATLRLAIASAQVKSCVLLAALAADGPTTVTEPSRSRDHTERMLRAAGVAITREDGAVTVTPGGELALEHVFVPADLSSAAFAIAAALLVPGSQVRIRDVGVNWTRTGFVRILRRMGASIEGELEERSDELTAEEPVSDLVVTAGPLTGTVVEPDEVPLAIDELPLVALLACFAEGETVVRGAQELRVKESDRIATVAGGLRGLGATIEATPDGFHITGLGGAGAGAGAGLRGGTIASGGDHRIAMLGAIAGLASREGVEVDGMEAARVSYPGFEDDVAALARA